MKNYSEENLDVTHYRNGDSIPFVEDDNEWSSLTIGAYCYYDNDLENGILYNGYAVNDSRGLAPEGWKIPTVEELDQIDLTTGLPGGYRGDVGNYYGIGYNGYWWSSAEYDTKNAWYRYLSYLFGNTFSGNGSKRSGLSVRCLKEKL